MIEGEKHKCPSCVDGKIITTRLGHDGYNTITLFSPCSNADCKSRQPPKEEQELKEAVDKLHSRERQVFDLLEKYLEKIYDEGVDVSYFPIRAKMCNIEFAKKVVEEIG